MKGAEGRQSMENVIAEHWQTVWSQKGSILLKKCKALGIQSLPKSLAISRLAGCSAPVVHLHSTLYP